MGMLPISLRPNQDFEISFGNFGNFGEPFDRMHHPPGPKMLTTVVELGLALYKLTK